MNAAPEKFKALWSSVQSMREMIADSYAANMNASDAAVLTLADEIDRLNAVNADLLAALQSMVSRIEHYTKMTERPNIEQWEYTEGSTDMAKARAAIAKAVQS